MNIIKPGTNYDFVSKQKPFLILSAALVVASLLFIGIFGLNYGVDFKGGSEIILGFNKDITTDEVRAAAEKIGFEKPDVQTFGDEANNFLVRVGSASFLNETNTKDLEKAIAAVQPIKRFSWSEDGGDIVYVRFNAGELKNPNEELPKLAEAATKVGLGKFTIKAKGTGERAEYAFQLQELQTRIQEKLAEQFGKDGFKIERVESVGPRVGEQLRSKGVVSLAVSILFILIYIAFRFDVRYAPGAVVALLHDVTITLGLYGVFGFEVSLPIIAALLTIVGYSLNDTIVIFDRIRENFENLQGAPATEIVNISVNESLSRTILTSLTTLLAVLALYFLGGGLIRNFSFSLIIGVIVGTYSSTFVASPIMIVMHNWLELRKEEKEQEEPEFEHQARV